MVSVIPEVARPSESVTLSWEPRRATARMVSDNRPIILRGSP